MAFYLMLFNSHALLLFIFSSEFPQQDWIRTKKPASLSRHWVSSWHPHHSSRPSDVLCWTPQTPALTSACIQSIKIKYMFYKQIQIKGIKLLLRRSIPGHKCACPRPVQAPLLTATDGLGHRWPGCALRLGVVFRIWSHGGNWHLSQTLLWGHHFFLKWAKQVFEHI